MPEASALGAILLKWGWTLISGVFGFLFVYVFRKTNDTYTKAETKEMIDLKIIPLSESIDRQTAAQERNTHAIERLVDALQMSHTDIAVVKSQVEDIKEAIKKERG